MWSCPFLLLKQRSHRPFFYASRASQLGLDTSHSSACSWLLCSINCAVETRLPRLGWLHDPYSAVDHAIWVGQSRWLSGEYENFFRRKVRLSEGSSMMIDCVLIITSRKRVRLECGPVLQAGYSKYYSRLGELRPCREKNWLDTQDFFYIPEDIRTCRYYGGTRRKKEWNVVLPKGI